MKGKYNKIIAHYDITVTGRVHHVGFRYSAENMARHFGVTGFVRNIQDGSVFLEIEGSITATELMIEWCRLGPSSAKVENVIVHDGEIKGYKDFKVAY